jgi:glycosyltransferase involved in cell wall biosynthesis
LLNRICFVVPTKNESESIQDVIEEIRGHAESLAQDIVILVVDDSSDDTRVKAKAAGAVVVNGDGTGLGSAMYKGLRRSLAFEPDIILSMDGDGQSAAEEIPQFLAPILEGRADLVLGSRFLDPGAIRYRYKPLNRLGVVLLSRMLKSQTGLEITDSHGGLRAMKPEVVKELFILGTHTYVQETIIDASEKGFRIVEVPSSWNPRRYGKSRVVRSIPIYIFYTWPVLFLRSGQHIHFLFSLGIVLVLAGLSVFLIVIVQEGFTWAMGNRTPAFILVALFFIAGIQLTFFGFILQLLKQIKKRVDQLAD